MSSTLSLLCLFLSFSSSALVSAFPGHSHDGPSFSHVRQPHSPDKPSRSHVQSPHSRDTPPLSHDRTSSRLRPREDSSVCGGNTAHDRSAWCDFNVDTNYYEDCPNTGVTREYWFELTNITAALDGVPRMVLAVNGTVPGPTIEADWGDTIVVHVKNSLENNGTGIHFHGVRQYGTNPMDGVPSITQCPTLPGQSITYTWRASQYGSSWWHSHFSLQAWEGVFGGIVIHGPTTANYDIDLGTVFLNDWDHQTVDELYSSAQTQGGIYLETGLINGKNTYNGDDGEVGERWETNFEPGKAYLFRLINAAIDTHFDFSIDGHTLQVVAADFVPVRPYYTHVLSIAMGQRYDVIVHANATGPVKDFWLRAVPDAFCSDNNNPDDIKGIIHYDCSDKTPTTSPWPISENNCLGEPLANIVPHLSQDCQQGASANITDLSVSTNRTDGIFKWYINEAESFVMDWGNPTALQIIHGNKSFGDTAGVLEISNASSWMTIVIESEIPLPHPIHLHGHDFYILAQGYGTYASANPTLNSKNPARRDVAVLPAAGYLVISFLADNPGAWLCHCHIGWHTEEGFALQFIERYDEIGPLYGKGDGVLDSCEKWNSWQTDRKLFQGDSGV